MPGGQQWRKSQVVYGGHIGDRSCQQQGHNGNSGSWLVANQLVDNLITPTSPDTSTGIMANQQNQDRAILSRLVTLMQQHKSATKYLLLLRLKYASNFSCKH